jgi:hypothetical protein
MPGIRVRTSLDFDDAKVRRHFEEHSDAAAEAAAEALGDAADQTAPIEDRTLINSRRTTNAENGQAVTYYDTDYAVRQHEDLTLQHDPGRRAKWLERAMAEERANLLRVAAEELKL